MHLTRPRAASRRTAEPAGNDPRVVPSNQLGLNKRTPLPDMHYSARIMTDTAYVAFLTTKRPSGFRLTAPRSREISRARSRGGQHTFPACRILPSPVSRANPETSRPRITGATSGRLRARPRFRVSALLSAADGDGCARSAR